MSKKKSDKYILKNRDLIRLKKGIVACEDLKGQGFSYALGKTLDEIERELSDLYKYLGLPKQYDEFQGKINELNEKMQLVPGSKVPEEKLSEYDESVEILRVKYKEHIDKAQSLELKMLDKEANVKIYQCPRSEVPADVTPKMVRNIIELISDE